MADEEQIPGISESSPEPRGEELQADSQLKSETTHLRLDLAGLSTEELLKRFEAAKREVQELKNKVGAASKKKEAAFRKKQELSKQIIEKIAGITGGRSERNAITTEVRELKRQRDALNQQIRVKVAEIKKITEENKDLLAKVDRDRKSSPGFLLKQIEQLEFKLETQPMSFDSEEKIRKKIKELKKEHEATKGQSAAFEQIRAMSKEIDRLKREANKFHRQVQEHAQQSQSKHESLLSESKEIDDLKKQEEELYQEFLIQKKRYTDANQELKEKVAEMQAYKDLLGQHNVKLREEQKQEELKTLQERAHEAEEKMRTRKKLTTEDLLALQGLKR